jgi:DNA polymerase delta subunit 1
VIHHVEIAMRESIWGYNGNQKTPFLKIVLHEPRMVPRVRSAFEDGEIQFGDLFQIPSLTFESNVVFELRFMIDTQVKHKNLSSLLRFLGCLGG